MLISGPVIGYIWLVVCIASYALLLIGVVLVEHYEGRFPREDSGEVVVGARWIAAVLAIMLAPSVLQVVVLLESETLYTLRSWFLWLHVVSFLANVGLAVCWLWLLGPRFREYAILRDGGTVTSIQE